MNKKVATIGLILTAIFVVSSIAPISATDYGNYDHAQGNGFQCATSPFIETQCEIENILKFFFPQFVSIGQSQDQHLQQIIQNQQKEIDLLTTLVQQNGMLVPHHVDNSTCHKSGTGVLCG